MKNIWIYIVALVCVALIIIIISRYSSLTLASLYCHTCARARIQCTQPTTEEEEKNKHNQKWLIIVCLLFYFYLSLSLFAACFVTLRSPSVNENGENNTKLKNHFPINFVGTCARREFPCIFFLLSRSHLTLHWIIVECLISFIWVFAHCGQFK